MEKYIKQYKTYMEKVEREGVEDLIEYVINETDFFTSPASSKFHSNFQNGLVLHSFNVMKLTYKMYNMFKDDFSLETPISTESIILCALHHDLCKCNSYSQEKRWYKDDDNQWQNYMEYKCNNENELGHGSKSLSMVQDFVKLTLVEKQAILYHMGSYDCVDKYEVFRVFNENKLAHILHIADMSSLVVEKIKNYKK